MWEGSARSGNTAMNIAFIAIARGKTVFVETPNPCADSTTDAIVARIADAQAAIVRENPGTHLIDQYHEIRRGMPAWASHLPDGIHPDDTLYTFKAAVEAQALIPVLPSL
jgi:cysteine synthase